MGSSQAGHPQEKGRRPPSSACLQLRPPRCSRGRRVGWGVMERSGAQGSPRCPPGCPPPFPSAWLPAGWAEALGRGGHSRRAHGAVREVQMEVWGHGAGAGVFSFIFWGACGGPSEVPKAVQRGCRDPGTALSPSAGVRPNLGSRGGGTSVTLRVGTKEGVLDVGRVPVSAQLCVPDVPGALGSTPERTASSDCPQVTAPRLLLRTALMTGTEPTHGPR